MFLTSRFTTQMNVFMHMMVCMRYCAHDFSTVPVPVHAEGTCVHVYPTPPPPNQERTCLYQFNKVVVLRFN